MPFPLIRSDGFPAYKVWPEGRRDFYTPIIYLEAFENRNLRTLGYDTRSKPVRRTIMAEARDYNSAALTGKVALVQETEQAAQPLVLLYVPVYPNGVPTETAKQRRAALFGRINRLYY